jgi:hypothetical protein
MDDGPKLGTIADVFQHLGPVTLHESIVGVFKHQREIGRREVARIRHSSRIVYHLPVPCVSMEVQTIQSFFPDVKVELVYLDACKTARKYCNSKILAVLYHNRNRQILTKLSPPKPLLSLTSAVRFWKYAKASE